MISTSICIAAISVWALSGTESALSRSMKMLIVGNTVTGVPETVVRATSTMQRATLNGF
jgi:hypothetical protein